MNRFRSCEGCLRHVLVSEQICPFCQRSLSAAPLPKQLKLPAGLSRAQRLAVAAAMAGQAACSSSTPEPIYGAPAVPIAGTASQSGTGGSSGGSATSGRGSPIGGSGGGQIAVPVYGAPLAGRASPVKDAGQDAGVGDDEDAGPKDAGPRGQAGRMAVPLYGAPVPVYGAPPNPKR